MDSFKEAIRLSTLDAISGYLQIENDERSRDKTAFSSHHGLYKLTTMPFGLNNSPATVQTAMDVILVSVQWQLASVYLNDTVVFSKSSADHIEQASCVLRLIYEAGVTLKLIKC